MQICDYKIIVKLKTSEETSLHWRIVIFWKLEGIPNPSEGAGREKSAQGAEWG